MDMVVREGRTFLVHGKGFNVHPQGGSATPGNDTKLVFHSDWRPALAVDLVPAEEYQVISLTLGDPCGLTTADVAVEQVVSNNSSCSMSTTVELVYNESLTNTFSWSFTEKLGVKVTTKGKTNLVFAEAEVSVEASFEFSSTQTSTTTTTTGVSTKLAQVVSIPAHKSVKVSVLTKKARGKIPFVSRVRSARGNEMEIKGNVDVTAFFKQHVVVTDV
jgi:hypothetical protein